MLQKSFSKTWTYPNYVYINQCKAKKVLKPIKAIIMVVIFIIIVNIFPLAQMDLFFPLPGAYKVGVRENLWSFKKKSAHLNLLARYNFSEMNKKWNIYLSRVDIPCYKYNDYAAAIVSCIECLTETLITPVTFYEKNVNVNSNASCCLGLHNKSKLCWLLEGQ